MDNLSTFTDLQQTDVFSLFTEFPITNTSTPVGIVWMTKDYSIFKLHEDNRVLVERQLKKLRESMSLMGWLPGSYVVIYPDGRVIEGYHRVTIARETNTPIYYIIIKDFIKNHVSLLNQGKEPWKITDHLNTHANNGNLNYIILRDFIKNHSELTPSLCLRICKNTDEATETKTFGDGYYEIKDMELAELWVEQLKKLRKYFLNRSGNPEKPTTKINSAFVRGFLYVAKQKDFSFERLYNNIIQQYPNGIYRMGLSEAQKLFTKIYNGGSRTENIKWKKKS